MLDFYKRIDKLLKQKKLSQKELSKFLDLSSVQIYSNWKQRDSIPSADMAVKIADFLETSVEYLIQGKEKDSYKEKYDNLKKSIIDTIEKTEKNN